MPYGIGTPEFDLVVETRIAIAEIVDGHATKAEADAEAQKLVAYLAEALALDPTGE